MAGGRTLGSVSSADPNPTTGTKPYDNFVHFLDMTEHLYYIQRPFHVELEFRRGCGDCIGVAAAVVFNPLNFFSSYLYSRLLRHFYAYRKPGTWLGVRYGVSTERVALVG